MGKIPFTIAPDYADLGNFETEKAGIRIIGHPSVGSEGDLDTALTHYPHPIVEELSGNFLPHRTKVEKRMHALGFRSKFHQ